jgi:hypothetical protein
MAEPLMFVKIAGSLPPVDNHGDIRAEDEYFAAPTDEQLKGLVPYIRLYSLARFSWPALLALGIDCLATKKNLLYECPFMQGNRYYWFLPTVWFPLDYKNGMDRACAAGLVESWRKDMLYDQDWMTRVVSNSHEPFVINAIERSMLGHGFDSYCSPDDGMGSLTPAVMKLSNGEFIGGQVWVWYNK